MKNALLLILFLFPIFCLAQNWGTKNSVWHYNQTMFEPPFNYDFIKFSVLGDTVIVGEDATIFQEDYFSLKDTVSSKLLMKSIDNRVYFFEPTLNAFQLLYDFNAVAGDTIQMFCRDEGNETYIKVKVDSVSKRNMNGTELKVQHVSTLQSSEYKYQMNGEIIENIGWTGFMFPLHRLADPPYGGNLRCFQNDDFELKLVDIDCDFFGPTQFKTEWASIGAKWHYTKMEGMMPPNEGYVLYEVIKDTVIQNKTVREIQKTYFHANGQDTTYLKSDFKYENGIVYFYGNGSFYQLYNFKAVAGVKWTIYGTDSIFAVFSIAIQLELLLLIP